MWGNGFMELWDLYDKDGNKTGEVWERKPGNFVSIPDGRYHIVSDILVKPFRRNKGFGGFSAAKLNLRNNKRIKGSIEHVELNG